MTDVKKWEKQLIIEHDVSFYAIIIVHILLENLLYFLFHSVLWTHTWLRPEHLSKQFYTNMADFILIVLKCEVAIQMKSWLHKLTPWIITCKYEAFLKHGLGIVDCRAVVVALMYHEINRSHVLVVAVMKL